jgi:predicted house-cleaning NTP pyrophosphatase (Maf/HAM1 superfamily)
MSISSQVGQPFRIAQIATDRSGQIHQAVSSHRVLARRGQMVDRWEQTALRLDPVDRVESLEYGQQASRFDGSRQ